MRYVKTLSAVARNEVDLCGQKAVDLALLQEAKFRTPQAFVILSTAFDDLVQKNNMKYKIDYVLRHVTTSSAQSFVNAYTSARRAVKEAKLPDDFEKEMNELYETLSTPGMGLTGGKKRSLRIILSINFNGDPENNDGVIQNINSAEEFLVAVREAWAIAYLPSQLKPRMAEHFPDSKLKIALLVQAMEDPIASCHAYSSVPQDPEKVYLQTYYGYPDLREKITKDYYAVSKNGLNIVVSEIRKQGTVLEKDEAGELVVVPFPEKSANNSMIKRDVQELARQIKKIEVVLNTPAKAFFTSRNEVHTLLWVNRLNFEPSKQTIDPDEVVPTADNQEKREALAQERQSEEYIELPVREAEPEPIPEPVQEAVVEEEDEYVEIPVQEPVEEQEEEIDEAAFEPEVVEEEEYVEVQEPEEAPVQEEPAEPAVESQPQQQEVGDDLEELISQAKSAIEKKFKEVFGDDAAAERLSRMVKKINAKDAWSRAVDGSLLAQGNRAVHEDGFSISPEDKEKIKKEVEFLVSES